MCSPCHEIIYENIKYKICGETLTKLTLWGLRQAPQQLELPETGCKKCKLLS